MLAHLLVSKYTDHLPLSRQEKIAARAGVDLPRQKLGRWVEASAKLLLTVHEQLAERIRASGYVQADETPVKVLDPDRGGRAAQAWLWTYHAPRAAAIVFDFNRPRGRDSPDRFLPADWSGALQSDGYELPNRVEPRVRYSRESRSDPGASSIGARQQRRHVAGSRASQTAGRTGKLT